MDAPEPMKISFGPSTSVRNTVPAHTTSTQVNENEETFDYNLPLLPTEDVPKVHKEPDNFEGDRVLANSILFLQDFGWWTEIAYAVPEGDIGRVFEILKVRDHIIIFF